MWHLFMYLFIYSFLLKFSGSQEKVTQSKDSVTEDDWSTTFKQVLENGTHGRGDEMKGHVANQPEKSGQTLPFW